NISIRSCAGSINASWAACTSIQKRAARLALLEEQKSLPWQAVWEMYCQRHDAPAGSQWLDNVRAYEKD
ncbi:L-rhamnose isomerase, partial [Enterobacter roggenkampii]|uniref:L-rhamnose isomerase n=1 Tax=Enterobacter roggenkampii TaxID=1812935 RepID=UPI001F0C5FDA